MRIKSGMNVKVIRGNHKGKEGKVLRVINDKNRVVVEGVNLIKKHTKPSQENPKGGIVEKEAAINISNIAIWNPKKKKADRIGYLIEDTNKKVRIFKSDNSKI